MIEHFQNTMYRKLKNNVRGYVNYDYDKETDTYYVHIYRKGVKFDYYIPNLSVKLAYDNYTSDDALNEILDIYKRIIFRKIFFREKKEDSNNVAS